MGPKWRVPRFGGLVADTVAGRETGETVNLDMESLVLHFRLDEEPLQRLFVDAGIGEPLLSGISVFANALPVMNVDLKAWEPDETFEHFVRTSGMRPLGPAGIYPFRKGEGRKESLGPVDCGSPVFAVEIDSSAADTANC